MVQKNRNALTIQKIEEVFQNTSKNSIVEISIDPILDLSKDKITRSNYKYINISFANLSEWSNRGRNKHSLSSIITPMKKMGGYGGNVKISVGRRKTSLERSEIAELISEIWKHDKFIKKAEVKVDDEEGLDIIDLFDNIHQEKIEYVLEAKEALAYEEAIKKMIYCFNMKKGKLYEAINFSEG